MFLPDSEIGSPYYRARLPFLRRSGPLRNTCPFQFLVVLAILLALAKYPMGEVILVKRKAEEEHRDKGGRRQVGVQKKSSNYFTVAKRVEKAVMTQSLLAV